MIHDIFNQFAKTLTNLQAILNKAQQHADSKKFDVNVLLNSRLAPDMFNLIRQVQIVSDVTKFGITRLSGLEAPSWTDNEATLADLQARLQKTIDYVKAIRPGQFEGWETRKTLNPRMEGKFLIGHEYLHQYVIPNFYFHIMTTYAILRHNGVDLGKKDFLGALNYQPL